MTPNGKSSLASIIIPCWNQLEFTRHCVRALARHTHQPWELIVIDNGSTDDTAAYLFGVQDSLPVPMTIIANKTNLGFPAAINQGLQAAKGEYLVLLNNDAVVTDSWLNQLIALVEMKTSGPPIGLAGPMSNYVSPPQMVENVPYTDLRHMETFASQWRPQHRGQWSNVAKLSGFCLLMKRAVYEAVGGLDERFGLGFFDDDDLAIRARKAGFEIALAHDLFIHHYGSRTFIGNGIDAGALLAENLKQFTAKWGEAAPKGKRVILKQWGTNASPGGEPPEDDLPFDPALKARVSLTMIVRNEENNLPHCLASAHGLFDEIVIVDTGSTDRTKDIALEYGAKVVDFYWIDDFAAARNVSLKHATGDYAFWLDADDVLDAPEREKLRQLFETLRKDRKTAYVIKCACDRSPDGGGETVVDHIRLFPIQGAHWSYRVHEQILPSLRQANISERWTDITVRHTGYTDPALRKRKLERDTRILLAALAERPDDPFTLFNLGAIAIEREQWQEALGYLCRSLERSAPTDSITRKLFALISRAHQMMGNSQAAIGACVEGLSFDANDAELWFRKAVLHRQRFEMHEAESCWRRILHLRRPEQFCSVDEGIYGHLTRRNLAVLAEERGDRTEASQQWQAVLGECPNDPEALRCVQLLAVT